ncbi:LGFP repeat-containing protein [Kitasatospora aburaviensis]
MSTRVDDLGDWVKKALDLDWNTCIQYPPGTGRTLCGPILTKYLELGGPATVGIPTTDTTATPVQPGKYAHFASPGSNTANTSIYWSAATGAHLVTGGTRSVWADNGWENGWLGFPITEESPTSPAPAPASRADSSPPTSPPPPPAPTTTPWTTSP